MMNPENGPTSRDHWSMSLGVILALALAAPAQRQHGQAGGSNGFQKVIGDAVGRMHAEMNVSFSGDADRDFARMMIPHHQGAIDMAIAELRYGKDKRLMRLAQEIIVEQQQEIAVMHLALGDPLAPGTAAPTQIKPQAHEQD